MGSARAPFRWTMHRASCFLHEPSASNHHPTHIRVKGQWRNFIELSLHTSGPSGFVWPSTWRYHHQIYQRISLNGSSIMQHGCST
eukprot:776396-Amphidinium_carterae.1